MLSGQWEERKDNTKSDTIPRSCWKTTLKTIVIKHLTDFGLEFAHTPACSWDQEAFIMSSAWGKNKKSNLWNIHLLTRAQGDCGRTLTHTHTHGRLTGEVKLESLTEMFIKECRRTARGITVAHFFLRLNSARLTRRCSVSWGYLCLQWEQASTLWGMT